MEVLTIGPQEKNKLGALRKHAKNNVISLETMMQMSDALLAKGNIQIIPVGLQGPRTIQIPIDFQISYSIEEHPEGKVRHMSVSKRLGESPSLYAVNMILEELGFENRISESGEHTNLQLFFEPLNVGQAINVMEIL